MRKVAYLLAALVMLPLVGAVTLQVSTLPGVLKPGTEGKLVLYITTTSPIKNLRIDVPETYIMDLEDEGSDIDLGDAQGGTVSTTLWFRISPEAKPGTYFLDFTVNYEDATNGTSYEEHFAIPITITSGEGVTIDFPSKVYGSVKKTVKITVKNGGDPVYSARLIVPDAVGRSDIYLGDLMPGTSVDKYVTLLPVCEGGIYRTVLKLVGYKGTSPYEQNFYFTVPCIPPNEDIVVDINVPYRVSGGEQVSLLSIRNVSSISTGFIAVSLTGNNIRFGGKTSFYINGLGPGDKVTFPVRWRLEKSDEPGIISVTLTTEKGSRVYTYSVLPQEKPQIQVYLTDTPTWEGDKIKLTVAVANTGTGTAENVFVDVEGNGVEAGKSLLGDLAPGDYDTVTFYLTDTNTSSISVKVEYYTAGKRITETHSVEISIPRRGSVTPWIVGLAVVAIAVYLWRRKKQ